jgi:hypothetical protein
MLSRDMRSSQENRVLIGKVFTQAANCHSPTLVLSFLRTSVITIHTSTMIPSKITLGGGKMPAEGLILLCKISPVEQCRRRLVLLVQVQA